MGTLRELPIIAAPSQSFEAVLASRVCAFTFDFNEWTGRWSFSLAIDGVLRLAGRRIVLGCDLIAPFGFGIGKLFAVAVATGAKPGLTELPSGEVRVYHYTEADEDE